MFNKFPLKIKYIVEIESTIEDKCALQDELQLAIDHVDREDSLDIVQVEYSNDK